MKTKKNAPNLVRYVLISLFIFILALLVSIISRMFLVADVTFTAFSNEQAGLVTSMIEGVVGAIAAGLVLYQLKISSNVEERQNDIEEAQFILQYNQAFIQDPNMCKVEKLLENAMLKKREEPLINDGNRQLFINYLVYLEGLAPLIIRGILKLEHVDDLFAYRFFLAMNSPALQKDQLFIFPEYYRGCFKLYQKWKQFRRTNNREVLMEENSLDKWENFEKYIDSDVCVRPISDVDNTKKIAELIYYTDSFIYPAAFGSVRNAKKAIPALISQCWMMFDPKNIFVASVQNDIAGVAVVLAAPPIQPTDSQKTSMTAHSLPKSFEHTKNNYFCNMNSYFDDCSVYIACISVGVNWRHQRIGEILLKNVLHTYSRQRIKLHVLCDNSKAIALYKKYGFKQIGEPQKGYAYNTQAPLCLEMIHEPNES